MIWMCTWMHCQERPPNNLGVWDRFGYFGLIGFPKCSQIKGVSEDLRMDQWNGDREHPPRSLLDG